ncbi:MAG: nuclear transport factor 2 family protein [Casimicrobiaceae bacterium]
MIGQSTNVSSFPSLTDYLREVECSRLRALVSRDMELAWQLHAPDFQLVTPRGNAFSREQYLGKIESGALRYLRWEPGPIVVRTHGETALLRYQATIELDSENEGGTPFQCWHIDSYELNETLWQVVWSQATAIK